MKRLPLAFVLLATACADHLPLEGAPCPCAAGTVCDRVSGTCMAVPPGTVCDETKTPVVCLPPASADAGALDATAALEPDAAEMPPPPDAEPAGMNPCTLIGLAGVASVEERFIPQRCGQAMCHGPSSVFPPRDLDKPAKIRFSLLGVKGALNCKNDYYIDPLIPGRSYFLATVDTYADNVTCPSGGMGGTRMPNRTGMPTILGPRLSDAEIACLRWWVYQVAQ